MPEFVNPDASRFDFELDQAGKQTGGLVCKKCKAEIQAVHRVVSLWLRDGPGPCAGTGQTDSEQIPYCPKCDPKPSERGVRYV